MESKQGLLEKPGKNNGTLKIPPFPFFVHFLSNTPKLELNMHSDACLLISNG
ncbi:hypothetical protein DsansV1_C04g0046181 [Dioscorea sansibarensis]